MIHFHETLTNSLTKTDGVGEKKARLLFTYFKAIDRIKCASIEDLMKVLGANKKLAEGIVEFFWEKKSGRW